MERKLDHAVSSGEAGKTVGWILDSSLALSARQIRSLKFQPDGILLNGIRVRTDVVVREGDCLSVTLRETGGCLLVPAEGAVLVIYEDEDILAVNKPSGVVVHPSPGHYADSLLNRLEGQGFSHLHSIGRLDRDTSGLMVFAKHKACLLYTSGLRARDVYGRLPFWLLRSGLRRIQALWNPGMRQPPDFL